MLPFLDDENLEFGICGKKAANLHVLSMNGFRVPRGFIVSPLIDLDLASDAELGNAVAAIGGFPVAVRSSGVLEDLESASFAGQYESYLDISTIADLRRHVAECRASGRSPRVRAYLEKLHLDPQKALVSVLVQKMVPAKIAGVGFSLHPITGREDHALVECCRGLGERLVAGQTDPSRYVIDLRRAIIVESSPGAEAIDLSAAQVLALRDLLLDAAALFGRPQDVEWAFDESGVLHLLQSRPITTASWRTDVEEFTNADFKDGGVSARVCTPLMFSLYRNAMQGSMPRYFRKLRLAGGESEAVRWIEMFYGRAYWNASATKRVLSGIPGFDEEKFDRDLGIQKTYPKSGPLRVPFTLRTVLPAIPVAFALERSFRDQLAVSKTFLENFPRIRAAIANDVAHFASTADEKFFLDLKHVIEDFHVSTEQTYFTTIYNNSTAQSELKSFLAKMDQALDCQTSFVSLLGGLSDISHMEMQRGLLRLCRVAKAHGFDGGEWNEALAAFLKLNDFHSDAELDLTVPRWGECPERVREMVEAMLQAGHTPLDPDATSANAKAIFEEEIAKIRANLARRPWLRLRYGKKFETHLRRVRAYLSRREQMRECSTQAYYLIRLYVLEAAKRLQRLGILHDPFEVFLLHSHELVSLFAAASTKGVTAAREEIAGELDYRLRQYRGYRDFTPPNELGRGVQQRSEGSYAERLDGKIVFRGIGCSASVAEGTARVIESLDKIHHLREGDILIARFTDPAWTPALSLVSGIVSEVGGLLSHAAVIGREYGIPAVLNLPSATKLILSGQRIRVDGFAGTVEVLS